MVWGPASWAAKTRSSISMQAYTARATSRESWALPPFPKEQACSARALKPARAIRSVYGEKPPPVSAYKVKALGRVWRENSSEDSESRGTSRSEEHTSELQSLRHLV